jgi:hypothetical protein
MNKLEAVIKVADIIRDLNLLDCDVIICDKNARILEYIQPRTFKGSQKIGEIASAGLVKEVLTQGKLLKKIVPETVYGVKLKAIMTPVCDDDGIVLGVIGTASNMKTQDTLHLASQSIAATSEEITATTEELAGSAVKLAESLMSIKENLEKITNEITKTNDILKFVNGMANSSSMLGINAAIEAAKAGEQGQGFRVVADKIREMAVKSSVSVDDISKIIRTIQNETRNLLKTISVATDMGQQQAAATEEIESAMQQLSIAASEIEGVAGVM